MDGNLAPGLESFIQARDFSALRARLDSWSPADLASLLGRLLVEDQVIVFCILPRKTAATVLEYLSTHAQELLLKAMAQEEVGPLLNDMAPDDRTLLLEELPASVTKQMRALLTNEERAIAVSLLGYPEDSIGCLMAPDYIPVRACEGSVSIRLHLPPRSWQLWSTLRGYLSISAWQQSSLEARCYRNVFQRLTR